MLVISRLIGFVTFKNVVVAWVDVARDIFGMLSDLRLVTLRIMFCCSQSQVHRLFSPM